MTPPIRMVSVPVDPTEAMLAAAATSDWLYKDDVASTIWSAMLTAAPVREEGGAVAWTEDMERERREADYERGFRHGQEISKDAAPVAWRSRNLDAFGDGAWAVTTFRPSADEVQPLFTTPPSHPLAEGADAEKLRAILTQIDFNHDPGEPEGDGYRLIGPAIDQITEALAALQQEPK